jgi:hypothetical protein
MNVLSIIYYGLTAIKTRLNARGTIYNIFLFIVFISLNFFLLYILSSVIGLDMMIRTLLYIIKDSLIFKYLFMHKSLFV